MPVNLSPKLRNFTLIGSSSLLSLVLILGFSQDILGRTQLNSLLRAKQWNKIENLFLNRRPSSDKEHYAIAVANINNALINKKNKYTADKNKILFKTLDNFLKILRIPCHLKNKNSKVNSEKKIISCLRSVAIESRTKNIQKLAALKAAKLANNYEMPWLSLHFISKPSLATNPVGEKIFQARLQQLIRNKVFSSALIFAKRKELKQYNKPYSNYLRAQAHSYAYQKDLAFHLYFKAAYANEAGWLHKNILSNVKKYYPKLFIARKKKSFYRRQLLALSNILKNKELLSLQHSYSAKNIIKSASSHSLAMDGVFFIRTKQFSALTSLGEKFKDVIKDKPQILSLWLRKFNFKNTKKDAKTNSRLILKLLGRFTDLLPKSATLWQNHLSALREIYGQNNTKYFKATVRYLKRYPYHSKVQDMLMASLLGIKLGDKKNKKDKINWAKEKHWEFAKKELRHYTANGRFFYWLRRYYRTHNKHYKNKKSHFYTQAPGSFYTTSLTNPYRKMRYTKAKKYKNPQAIKIWSDLKRMSSPDNDMIRLLFSMGEWTLAVQSFREIYADKIPRREYLLGLIQLGRWSKTLNVQIYYLRQLLREEGISIDPFTLPLGLAKLMYPRPHLNLARRYAKKYGLDQNMAYALMHQESLFRESAVSRTGAQGLMQIMPRTGKWLSKLIFKTHRRNDFNDPETNIHFGNYYFSRLMKKNERDFRWAAIAYNGGPGNLRKWKRKIGSNDLYLFLEKLPVKEARDYCRITYENYLRYKIIYNR